MEAAVQGILAETTALRHYFHQNPEPSYEEFETHKKIRSFLCEVFGVEDSAIRTYAGTGMTLDVKGKGPASDGVRHPVIMLRADMDALRMEEANEHLAYRSQRAGVAHLCGHDGHMASLMGAAKILSTRLDRLPSNATVRLLFQPAEEGGAGALKMVQEGCLEGVDAVYGFHNWPNHPTNTMAVAAGPVMAQAGMFYITLKGKGGHGSTPYTCVDPLVAGASLVSALQTVISRNVPFKDSAVLSVCSFNSGTAHNVIPETARITGTVRSLTGDITELFEQRIRTITEGIAAAHGCSVDIQYDRGYPPVINHEAETEFVREVGADVYGPENVTAEGLPLLAGEDFAYFLQERPGCFFFLGGKFAEGVTSINHSPHFNWNDETTPYALRMWLRLIEKAFGCTLF